MTKKKNNEVYYVSSSKISLNLLIILKESNNNRTSFTYYFNCEIIHFITKFFLIYSSLWIEGRTNYVFVDWLKWWSSLSSVKNHLKISFNYCKIILKSHNNLPKINITSQPTPKTQVRFYLTSLLLLLFLHLITVHLSQQISLPNMSTTPPPIA